MPLKPSNGRVIASLGRKGVETRARLLNATRELLQTTSPFHLTVSAIAKAAATSPATLYVYFNDVEDVLYALCVDASEAFDRFESERPEWFTDAGQLTQDCTQLVEAYNRIWEVNRHVLHYRNLEADRGNVRFWKLQLASAQPILDRLISAIKQSKPQLNDEQARADAIVLYCAMERLAGVRHWVPEGRTGPPVEELDRAQVRILAQHLTPD